MNAVDKWNAKRILWNWSTVLVKTKVIDTLDCWFKEKYVELTNKFINTHVIYIRKMISLGSHRRRLDGRRRFFRFWAANKKCRRRTRKWPRNRSEKEPSSAAACSGGCNCRPTEPVRMLWPSVWPQAKGAKMCDGSWQRQRSAETNWSRRWRATRKRPADDESGANQILKLCDSSQLTWQMLSCQSIVTYVLVHCLIWTKLSLDWTTRRPGLKPRKPTVDGWCHNTVHLFKCSQQLTRDQMPIDMQLVRREGAHLSTSLAFFE